MDKENRYSDFTIISLPYPGCEFFKTYRDNGYNGEDLIFEWNQTHVDANIFVPSDSTTASMSIDWSAYRVRNFSKKSISNVSNGFAIFGIP